MDHPGDRLISTTILSDLSYMWGSNSVSFVHRTCKFELHLKFKSQLELLVVGLENFTRTWLWKTIQRHHGPTWSQIKLHQRLRPIWGIEFLYLGVEHLQTWAWVQAEALTCDNRMRIFWIRNKLNGRERLELGYISIPGMISPQDHG